MSDPRTVILGAHYSGIGDGVAWQSPQSGSQTDYDSQRFFARSAEEAKFDLLFNAETLSVFEKQGEIIGSYISGRPDALTLHAALASVTEHIGIVSTVNATFHNAWIIARQYATLEALSGGRSGWNVVTNMLEATTANFSVGDYLPRDQRYQRAAEVVELACALWDASTDDVVTRRGAHIMSDSRSPLPRSPQGRPLLMQAGESDEGREFAARGADMLFTFTRPIPEMQAQYAEVKDKAKAHGRDPDSLKILPALRPIVADTDADAEELGRYLADIQVTVTRVLDFFEPFWGYNLEAYDVDGPLPEREPDWEAAYRYTSRLPSGERDARVAVARFRAAADAEKLTMRQIAQRFIGKAGLTGSPQTIANYITHAVDERAADGFILGTSLLPHGLSAFYESVVPLLQERKVFRTEYESDTLRGNLGLPPFR